MKTLEEGNILKTYMVLNNLNLEFFKKLFYPYL